MVSWTRWKWWVLKSTMSLAWIWFWWLNLKLNYSLSKLSCTLIELMKDEGVVDCWETSDKAKKSYKFQVYENLGILFLLIWRILFSFLSYFLGSKRTLRSSPDLINILDFVIQRTLRSYSSCNPISLTLSRKFDENLVRNSICPES